MTDFENQTVKGKKENAERVVLLILILMFDSSNLPSVL